MLHCRMLDSTAQLQQEALGILGVNLVHGALSKAGQHYQVLAGLMDDLSRSRIEVRAALTSCYFLQYFILWQSMRSWLQQEHLPSGIKYLVFDVAEALSVSLHANTHSDMQLACLASLALKCSDACNIALSAIHMVICTAW